MLESMKKTLLAGLGVVAFTKEKLEKLVEELVEKGELSRDQGKKLLKTLLEKGDVEGKNLMQKITQEVERWMSRGPLATRGELRSLQERVSRLEESNVGDHGMTQVS
ncbi:MAG: hypothetical protein O7J95_07710 [Planctomycetota bacterium]|nr:hypothetical protein [Planctomycetota bacterium]